MVSGSAFRGFDEKPLVKLIKAQSGLPAGLRSGPRLDTRR
jgi:hypothetical protein